MYIYCLDVLWGIQNISKYIIDILFIIFNIDV